MFEPSLDFGCVGNDRLGCEGDVVKSVDALREVWDGRAVKMCGCKRFVTKFFEVVGVKQCSGGWAAMYSKYSPCCGGEAEK